MRVSVVAVSLLFAVSLGADLTPGPERPVAPPMYGSAYGYNHALSVASDGEDFLVVWARSEGLYVNILAANGESRTVPPRLLVRTPDVSAARAVWTGSAYAVFYDDEDGIAALRVDRDGTRLGEPVRVTGADTYPLDVAWNGRHFLIATGSRRQDFNAAFVDADLRLVRTLTLPGIPYFLVDLAASGDKFLVASSVLTGIGVDRRISIRMARLSANATFEQEMLVAAGLMTPTSQLSIESDGTRAGIGFVLQTAQGYRLYRYAVDVQAFSLTTPALLPALPVGPRVVRTAAGLKVVYFSGTDLAMVPIDGEAPATIALAARTSPELLVAANHRAVMAVWDDATRSRVTAVTLDASATQLVANGFVPMSISQVAQSYPVLAPASADLALAAWIDLTPGEDYGNVFAIRVDRRGFPVDREPMLVASRVTVPQHERNPFASGGRPIIGANAPVASVARLTATFTGRVWMLAWHVEAPPAQPRVFTRRIALDGTLADAQPVEVGTGFHPALASNGNATVLAMLSGREGTLSFTRFTPEGTRIDNLAAGYRLAKTVSIATNGSEFFVAYTRSSLDVEGLRLDASGAPMDAAPIAIASGLSGDTNPEVASDGTDFLVAYNSLTTQSIQAARVLRNGVLADKTKSQDGEIIAFGQAGNEPMPFSIARTEGGYLIAFRRDQTFFLAKTDVRGELVEPPQPLAVSEPAAAPQVAGNTRGIAIAIATFGDHGWLAYARAPQQPESIVVPRVFVRSLGDEPGRRRGVRH